MFQFYPESPCNESRSESEMKAKRYYLSCIDNNKTRETLGAAPLLKLLQEFGGWSVSNSSGVWNVSKFNFQDTLQKIHALGLSNFFNIWVGEDEKDPTKNILQVSLNYFQRLPAVFDLTGPNSEIRRIYSSQAKAWFSTGYHACSSQTWIYYIIIIIILLYYWLLNFEFWEFGFWSCHV